MTKKTKKTPEEEKLYSEYIIGHGETFQHLMIAFMMKHDIDSDDFTKILCISIAMLVSSSKAEGGGANDRQKLGDDFIELLRTILKQRHYFDKMLSK